MSIDLSKPVSWGNCDMRNYVVPHELTQMWKDWCFFQNPTEDFFNRYSCFTALAGFILVIGALLSAHTLYSILFPPQYSILTYAIGGTGALVSFSLGGLLLLNCIVRYRNFQKVQTDMGKDNEWFKAAIAWNGYIGAYFNESYAHRFWNFLFARKA